MLRVSLLRVACAASSSAASICDGALAAGSTRCLRDPCTSQSNPSTSAAPWTGRRGFASDAPASEPAAVGNAKVQKLADEILALTVLESSWLTEILRKKLNISKPAYGAMPMGMAVAAAPAAAPAAAAAPEAAKPAEKKEKTEFELKLESFSAEGKIKVIKEIRAITSLGLKEAKELVEKAPVVIKGGLPKADAENLKKLIEAAGGKVSLA